MKIVTWNVNSINVRKNQLTLFISEILFDLEESILLDPLLPDINEIFVFRFLAYGP